MTRVFLRLNQNETDRQSSSATVESAFKANRSFIEPENHHLASFLILMLRYSCFILGKQNETDKAATLATVESAFKVNRSFIELETRLLASFLLFLST